MKTLVYFENDYLMLYIVLMSESELVRLDKIDLILAIIIRYHCQILVIELENVLGNISAQFA